MKETTHCNCSTLTYPLNHKYPTHLSQLPHLQTVLRSIYKLHTQKVIEMTMCRHASWCVLYTMPPSAELKHVEPLAITIQKSEYFHDFTALDSNSRKDTSQELVIRNVLVLDCFYLGLWYTLYHHFYLMSNRTPKF